MSSSARSPGVVPQSQTGIAVSGSNKYVSLYVLLSGIIGGVLLILSLVLFCKYCRGKFQGAEGVGVSTGGNWVLREASFSLEQPDHEEGSISAGDRDREEVQDRRGSWSSTRSRYDPSEESITGAEGVRTEMEDTPRICKVSNSSRLVDDHVKTNIFLHRQKSSTHHSPPITCFSKPNPEAVECEVAVEIHPGPNVNSSSSLKSGQPPLIRHASVSSLNPSHAISKGSWERSEEVDGEGEQRVPWRASSTDWTKLETSLDFWRQEHSRAQQEDSSRLSKVRYNDTGSLEEVSVDNCVDYFVEDEIMVHLEADRENMRQQYRRLWQLRATLEEDEDSKKPSVKHQSVPTQPTPPSPDQSPDPEAPGSHTTSFESNTEPLLEETRFPPHLLQLPSYETRRQNYRNILNWRLRKMEARNARRHGTVGRQTSLEDTSFDSMDTVDTEESSTDASRLDQATTSFESTTDNTDSPGEQQVHRLQQLRADSGYRSLENPVPNSLKLLYPQQHVISSDGDPPHRIPSLGESFEDVSEAEEAILDDIDIEGCPIQRHSCAESELDEGVAGLRSPPYSLYESTSWDGRRKPGGQPTSKKRRDLGGSAEYMRDYSVDEKSDALFREFSRCEVDSKRHHRLTAYRRLRGPYPYPKLNEPQADCVLGFSLVDDEVTLASVPIIRVAPDEDSSDHV